MQFIGFKKIFSTNCNLFTFLHLNNRKCLVLQRCLLILMFNGLCTKKGDKVEK